MMMSDFEIRSPTVFGLDLFFKLRVSQFARAIRPFVWWRMMRLRDGAAPELLRAGRLYLDQIADVRLTPLSEIARTHPPMAFNPYTEILPQPDHTSIAGMWAVEFCMLHTGRLWFFVWPQERDWLVKATIEGEIESEQ